MSNSPFIEQLYARFLGRAADSAGLAYWSDLLDRGVFNAAEITQQFLDSREFSDAIEPVARLYYTAFGRIPDAAGLQYWISQAQAGTGLDDIAAAFAGSSEFKSRFGAMDNREFIEALYHSALDHDAPAAVRGTWLADLDASRATRGEILQALADSAEVIRETSDAIRVIAQYHGTLAEAPTAREIESALARQDDVGLLTQLYGSRDYIGADVPGLVDRGTVAPRSFVFIDTNGNGKLDQGEFSASTDSQGHYSFDGRAAFGNLVTAIAGGSSGGGSVVAADLTAPTLTGGTTVNGATGQSVTTLNFTFNEVVQKGSGRIIVTNGHTQYFLNNGVLDQRIVGETHGQEIYVSGSEVTVSGNTLTITLANSEATALRGFTSYSVVMEHGAVTDAAGNAFKGLGQTDVLRFTTGAGLDITRPTATAAQYMEGGYYTVGEHIDIKVTFSEVVFASAGAGLHLELGDSDGFAEYHAGEGTNTLWFRYTVQEGDLASPLTLTSTTNGLVGNIEDASGNVLDNAHVLFNSLTYGGGSYGSPLNVDGIVPVKPTLVITNDFDQGTFNDDGWLTSGDFDLGGANVEPLSTVVLYRVLKDGQGNDYLSEFTNTFSATGSWYFDLNSMPEGQHRFKIKVIDQAGNVSPLSDTLEVNVDFTAPAAPTGLALRADQDNGNSPSDGVTTFTQPIFTGTAEAFAKVKLRDANSNVLGEAVANASGYFEVSPTSALSLNTAHALHVIQVDRAGNLGPTDSATATVTVIAPTGSPAAPSAPVFGDGMDTGEIGDGLTNISTITLSVSGVLPNQTLRIYDKGVFVKDVTAPASGPWTGALTLAPGAHTITVQNVDGNGGISAQSTALAITVDTTAPNAPSMPLLYGPNDKGVLGDHKTNVTSPRLVGTAEPGTKLELMVVGNSTPLNSVSSNGGSYDLEGALGVGSHQVYVRSTDAAGNVTASAVNTIHISTTAPSALGLAPDLDSASDTGSSDADNITSSSSVRIYGDSSNGRAVPAGYSVAIYNGDELLYTVTASNLGAWDKTLSLAASETPYQLSVKVIDEYGNESAKSPVLAVTVDQTAPDNVTGAAVMDPTDDKGQLDGRYTNLNGATLTGTGAPANTRINIYDNTMFKTFVTSDASGNWTTGTDLSFAPGDHTITLKAVDTAGNLSPSASPSYTLTIDQTAPALSMGLDASSNLGTSSSDDETSDNTPTFSGTVEAGSIVTLLKGMEIVGTDTTTSDGNWSITSNAISITGESQTFSFTVQATDRAGNTNTFATPIGLTIDITAPSQPSGANIFRLADSYDTGSSSTDLVTNLHMLKFHGENAPAGVRVLIYHDDIVDPVAYADANASGVWTTATEVDFIGTLNDESHVVKIAYMDKAGNISPKSAGFTLRVDKEAPTVTMAMNPATDTGVNSDRITSNNAPGFSGTVSADSTVDLYMGSFFSSSMTVTGTSWTGAAFIAPQGESAFTVKATDLAGNVSTSSAIKVTVDTDVPDGVTEMFVANDTLDFDYSSTDRITRDATPAFTGKAGDDGDTVTIYSGSTAIATGVVSGDTFTTGDSSITLSGSNNLTAVVTDAAGSTSASFPFTVIVDTDAPTTTAATPTLHISSKTGTSTSATSDATPMITGTGTDGDSIILFQGGTTLAHKVARLEVVSGVWTYVAVVSPNTSTTFYAAIVDAAGNLGPISSGFTLTHDSIAANVSLDLLTDGGSVDDMNDNDDITTSGSHTFSGTAPANETLDIYINGVKNTTVIADGSGNYTFTTSPQSSSYTFSARLPDNAKLDAAGNEATYSTISVTVDDTAPAFIDEIVRTNNAQTAQVTFEEAVFWDGSGAFEILDSGGVVQRTATNVTWDGSGTVATLTWSGTLVDAGNYSVRAPATLQDAAGKTMDLRTTQLAIDTIAPQVSSSDFNNGTLRVWFDESSRLTDSGTIEIYNSNGTLNRTITSAGFDGPLYIDTSENLADLAQGTYVAVFNNFIEDLAGNIMTSSFATGVTFTVPDLTAPAYVSAQVEDAFLKLTFDENIAFDALGEVHFYNNNDVLVFTLTAADTQYYSILNNTITFSNLFSQLPPIAGGYSYTVALDGAIEDLHGNINSVALIGYDSGLTWRPLQTA